MSLIQLNQKHLLGRKTTEATAELINKDPKGGWIRQRFTWPDGESIELMTSKGYYWEI